MIGKQMLIYTIEELTLISRDYTEKVGELKTSPWFNKFMRYVREECDWVGNNFGFQSKMVVMEIDELQKKIKFITTSACEEKLKDLVKRIKEFQVEIQGEQHLIAIPNTKLIPPCFRTDIKKILKERLTSEYTLNKSESKNLIY